jgi:hypothetical protein
MKTEQRRMVWRFAGSIALIAAMVGMATIVSHWIGPEITVAWDSSAPSAINVF